MVNFENVVRTTSQRQMIKFCNFAVGLPSTMHRLRFVGPYVGRNGTNDGKSEIRSVQETTLIFAVFEDHLMIGLLQNEPTLS